MKNQKENAYALSSKITEIFEGDELELQQEIKLFNSRHSQKQNELEDKEMSLQTANVELNITSKKIEESDRKYHSLLESRCREQELYAEKAEHIEKMCKDLNINVDFDIKNSNDQANSLVVSIRTAIGKVNEKIKEIMAENEQQDAEQEKEIRKHREDEIRVKSEMTSISKQLSDLEMVHRKLKDELRKIEQSGNKLNEITQQIGKLKSACEELETSSNTQGLRDEITSHRDEKQNLSDELEDVDVQITSISTMTSLLAEVNSKENHIKKRESEVRRILNKHHDSFQRLFPNENIENIEPGIKRKIETLNQDIRQLTSRLEAEIRLKENLANVLKNQLQNKKQELNRFENELRHLEDEIDKECEQTPFDEILANTKENCEKYQMEYSTLKSSDVFYKK